MENKPPPQEKEENEKSLRDLQRSLNQDLLEGHFYGLDQKIRNLQKAFDLLRRV